MAGWIAGAIVVGGALTANAAGNAADAQSAASGDATAEQRRQYDLTRSDMVPWMQAGSNALGTQQALLGQSGSQAQQEAFDNFRQSPGQAFLQARGQKNLLAGASAIGGLGGGNVREALVQQGVGFAQQDFGDYYSRLAGLSGTGQQTSAQLGQFGANAATNIGNNQIQAGQARASGILGQQQVAGNTISQLGQLGGQQGWFSSGGGNSVSGYTGSAYQNWLGG